MSSEIFDTMLLLLYQISIFSSSLVISYRIVKKENISLAKLGILIISISIIISSSISMIFSFFTYNFSLTYVLSATSLAGILHLILVKSDYNKYKQFITNLINNFFDKIFSWKILFAFIIFLPIILDRIYPLLELDSWYHMNYLIAWLNNQATPYYFAFNYVSFWELSYLPSLVITHSDNFLWLESIKPIILIGLGIYLIGRELGIPKFLNTLQVFSGILFFHFWFLWSGVSTIKNDMVFGGGIVLLAYCLIKNPKNLSTWLIFLFGAIFVANKFTGIIVLTFAIILLIFQNKEKILKNIQNRVVWLSVFLFFITSGHFYVKNLVFYQNPFYPIIIKFKGIGFTTGSLDLSGTSILSSLGNEKIWEYLFPADLVKASIILPIYLGIIGCFTIIAYTIFNFKKTKTFEKNLVFLTLFILGNWLIYFASSWSASATPGDFKFIENLGSLRYVEGLVVINEIVLVFLFWRLGVPQKMLATIIGGYLFLRLFGLYNVIEDFDYLFLVYPLVFVIVLIIFSPKIPNVFAKTSILSFLVISIFIFSPALIEQEREKSQWIEFWDDTIFQVYRIDESKIGLLYGENIDDNQFWNYVYPISGNKFQHDVTISSIKEFIENDGKLTFKKTSSYQKPDYLVSFCGPNSNCEQEFKELALDVSKFNYVINSTGDQAILLQLTK